ncbi:thioredoxin Y, chloroplastic-like isoform X1 [Musa acuminata AAA Group]|uniref:thioredoxin Y, chloroplastic-like isoform X1 n=1 Tax=Musa acuminata AAA Group TaxID=214697 RepID=UPI0031E10ADC
MSCRNKCFQSCTNLNQFDVTDVHDSVGLNRLCQKISFVYDVETKRSTAKPYPKESREMAASRTAAAAPVATDLRTRSICLCPLELSAVATPRFSPLRRQSMLGRGLTAVPQRRLLPRIEAKKQTYSSFDELLEKCDKLLLVDFYATWCGPCQFMVSVLEEVGEKLKDRIQVIKIDTEKYTNIANCYQIEALPTFIIFRDGKPCDRFEGAMPAHQLIQRIEAALKVKQ